MGTKAAMVVNTPKGGGNCDFEYPVDHVVDRMTVVAYFGVGGFSHHDRIIDHDPENDQEAEQTDQVDGHSDGRQHPQRAEKGDQKADHDPESQFQSQKQGQDQEHQQRAGKQVFRPSFPADP